jgi:hypothetical protein
MDSFATLNGITPQWDKIKVVNTAVQKPTLQEVTKRLGEAKDFRSFGISAQLSQAIIDASQAMVNSDKSAADAAADIQAAADTK